MKYLLGIFGALGLLAAVCCDLPCCSDGASCC